MTAFSLLLILIGIFIIINSPNFVKVLKGDASVSFLQPKSGLSTTSSTQDDTLGGTSSGQH